MKDLSELQAFGIDFNWGPGGINAFASPGLWADADPQQHVDWYRGLGANVIQTFCISCNGYAWYKDGVVPAQPGLKHDFLPEVVRLGHDAGMKVMGYFCIGSNTLWGQGNPDLSYDPIDRPHIPYTDAYLEYLESVIEDALVKTGIDGFMIDWIWSPIREERPRRWWLYDNQWKHHTEQWMESEKELYVQLMGEAFPEGDLLSTEQEVLYGQRAIDRCWKVIHDTVKRVKPEALVWLSCNNVDHPHLRGSVMFDEVDWFMNEHPDSAAIVSLKDRIGEGSGIMQCLCGWGDKHDAATIFAELASSGVGYYGFARPDASSFPPMALDDDALADNAQNIETIRAYYCGAL